MSELIREVNELNYTVEELNESGQPKKFKLKGVFQASDVPNGNKRVYPRMVLESAVNGVKTMVDDKRMIGELDHPNDAKIHLEKVSHMITKLEINSSGQVYGEAEVLPTASGKILESLLKSGVKLGISSRGYGSTKKANGLDEVQNDYRLVTFDVVSDPSTPGAFPQAIYEHKEEQQEIETKEEKSNSDGWEEYTTSLKEVVEDILDDSITTESEKKNFLCTDGRGNRFYLIESEKDSYGTLKFHISHDYHIEVKKEDFQERIALYPENIRLVEDVYGSKTSNKILSKVEELGYNSKTFLKNKEE